LTEPWNHLEENHKDTKSQTVYKNRSLKHLRLYGNNIEDEDMKHVGVLLQYLTCLGELDLDSNEITDAGLASFASIDHPSHLRVLRLSGNRLTNQASHALLYTLKVHAELDSVTCNGFWKNSPCEKEIRHFLNINGAGRVLLRYVYNKEDDDVSHPGKTTAIARDGDRKVNNCSEHPTHSPSVPDSIWPLVFARINRGNPMTHLNFGFKDGKMAANGIFYLLRHGPILLEYPGSQCQERFHATTGQDFDKKRKQAAGEQNPVPFHWLSGYVQHPFKRLKSIP
jgi:Leucine-rich repeat (LRR) protein